MTDRISILTANPRKPLTKIISEVKGEAKVSSPKMPMRFSMESIAIEGIDDLYDLSTRLEDESSSCMIRGKLVDGINPSDHYRRMITNKEGGAYEQQDLHTLILDFDKIPVSILKDKDFIKTPDKVINSLIKYLPSIFHDASVLYRFSSSQGFKGDDQISCHLTYWLDAPVSSHDLKIYFNVHNEMLKVVHSFDFNFVDPALFNPIQPIFTAAPILEDGIKDRLKKRIGIIEKQSRSVEWTTDWAASNLNAEGNEAFWGYLERVGDDKDGFHMPIMQTVASYVRHYGEPTMVLRAGLKDIIREAVDAAHISEDRDPDAISRYKSDHFIDQLLAGAIAKGFGKGVMDSGTRQSLMDRYVYVEAIDEFYDTIRGVSISERVLNNIHLRDNGGKNISKTLLKDREFRNVYTIQPVPGEEDDIVSVEGRVAFNTWRGRPIKPAAEAGNMKILDDHLKFLVDGDLGAFKHLKSFLAHLIAKPGVKIKHMMVIGSKHQGTGKSYIKYLMNHLLGEANVRDISNVEVKSSFNGWATSLEVGFIEEMMVFGRVEVANNLKPYITEDNIVINEKFKPAFVIKNRFNLIAFTNHRDAAIIEQHDRRYWVWYSEAKPRTPRYYEKLFNWTRDNAAEIYRHFLDLDLSEFKYYTPPPRTFHAEEMSDLSRGGFTDFVQTRIEEGGWPFRNDLVVISHLLDEIGSKFRGMTSAKIGRELRNMGAISLGQKRFADGSKPKVWAIRETGKWKKASESEIVAHYQKPGKSDDPINTEY